MKYAIQIPFEGQWLYITEGFGQEVKLFDSEDAAKAASVWVNSKVVQYQL
jgi:hypothetical protein